MFFSRLLPVVSFDIISYGAGLTKMSLRNFTLATFLGMLALPSFRSLRRKRAH
ncbi:MAG: VTT domain-containing protein [Deltaproteobacteria bacterium]|nr:MAG: VTT domain-containing protein [Deltaproteobacteria bacterium]